jgi:RimJ/RimL family protein N-acetyltransferase
VIVGRRSASRGFADGYRGRVPGLSFPITTSRLTLRPYERDDLAFLHSMFGRDDVVRFLPWTAMDLDQARAKLEQRVLQTHIEADADPLVLIAVESHSGRAVGEFMLRLRSLESRQGEIGWSLHPDAQGRGFATEGAREMFRLGFDELGLHRIAAGCDSRNTASLRVMERLGMRREADFVDYEYLKGEWASEIVCAKLESEWRAEV